MTDQIKLMSCLIGYSAKPDAARLEVQNQLKVIDQKIAHLAEEKKDVVDLYAKGQINREMYGQKCQQYDTNTKTAKIERDRLLATVPPLHKKDVVETSIEQYCAALKSRWEKNSDFDSRRQLLLDYAERIIFSEGKVEMHGSIPIILGSYADPEQSSEARKMQFVIRDAIE